MSRVQLHNLTSFTGGLNMRADAFQLGEDESPEMLNVEIDPRGGFYSRKGWTRWNEDPIVAGAWNPRHAYTHQDSFGVERVFVTNEARILVGENGAFDTMKTAGAVELEAAASPHLADFADWGDDVYVARGRTLSTVRWNGTNGTALTPTGAGQWQDDYTDPGASNHAPQAELVCSHAGYLFVANVREDGTNHPNRLRWSHPNNPGAWAELDRVDIKDGGGAITAIVPLGDHLLVFKTTSVWAVYGYDLASFQVQNVTRALGCPHRQAAALSEAGVFFYSPPSGIFAIRENNAIDELSESLRPMFESRQFNLSAIDAVWIGWVGQRVWFSAPWHPTEVASDARTVFALDPTLGAWSMHRAADDTGVGPFAGGAAGGSTRRLLAASRSQPSMLDLAGADTAQDDLDGTPVGFASMFTTRWVHASLPTVKKSWRRPDFVMRERDLPYQVVVEVLHDYDEATIKRTGLFIVDTRSTSGVWGDFDWGDGTLWGRPPEGSVIERGRGLGTARAVQLRFKGQTGRAWGCDALVLKFISRRVR